MTAVGSSTMLAIRSLFLVLSFLAAPLLAQEAESGAGAHGGGHAKSTMEMGSAEFFVTQYSHLVPHRVAGDEHSLIAIYNVNVFQWITLGIMAVVFLLVLASFRSKGRTPWLIRVFRGWCLWLRDEVVFSVMGKEDGARFAPYFIYLFFFLAIANLISLVPGSVTANACIFVTGAMAVITLVMMVVGGMMQQGIAKYWINLIPHGLPVALIPLMVVIELLSLVIKPFALMIRLFANMLAGHLVVYSFIGLIFLFAKMMEMNALSWLTALPALGLAIFILIIEAFVALLQAYIFTYLSVIFIHQARHPDH